VREWQFVAQFTAKGKRDRLPWGQRRLRAQHAPVVLEDENVHFLDADRSSFSPKERESLSLGMNRELVASPRSHTHRLSKAREPFERK